MRPLLLLTLPWLAGCFYLAVINIAPVAKITRTDVGPVYKGTTLRFTASDSVDEDGDDLSYAWNALSCSSCSDQGDGMEFSVNVFTHDTVRVRLVVTDGHGAVSATETLDVPVDDRPPTVKISVQGSINPDGTYTLARPIVFSATAGDPDGDTPKLSAVVHPPPQSDPAKLVFETDGKTSTVVPDAPGHYELEVTADDQAGKRTTERLGVEVSPDRPPCVAATSPVWSPDGRIFILRADGARRFAVQSVTDDLDAWPGGEMHFRWLVARAGEPLVEIAGHDLPDLLLDPEAYDPGDVLAVRVEIGDRVTRTLPCAADQAACSIGGSECLQRITWTAEVR